MNKKKDILLYARKEECCGCTACYSSCPQFAISMVEDEEGFLYPEINSTLCVKCGICLKVCPFKNIDK
jgi:formate hydrogenlyase subunit 6/NADH:ubiquinone oxidoreductase subunit I